eukprot:6587126-Ditylum_brightwellii.AAC.1
MVKHRHVRNSLALLTLIPMIRQFIPVKELMYDTREIIPDPGDPEPKPVRVPVFYNVYADVARISLATSIIKEQITQLRPEHE